jgi:nucleoid-associated protein YgaU
MIYLVKADTDLWLLAAWYYGDPRHWDIIYFANIETIGDDPETLPLGASLEIPALESVLTRRIFPVEEEMT